MPRILPVIMCGGSGTRMWPESRESLPKQFLPLLGPRSTFQNTIAMLSDRDVFERPLILTNHDYRFLVAEQLAAIGAEAEIVIEPVRRDSAAAVAMAAELAALKAPDTVVAALAADHCVQNPAAFLAIAKVAATAAAQGRLVTLGVKPDHPATGYGYIRAGSALEQAKGAFEVQAFVEKPDEPAAKRLIAEGCLWNSGNFFFRADAMQAEIARFEPAIADAAARAVALSKIDLQFRVLDEAALSEGAQEVHRLRRHGAHQARRRGAGGHGLVGRRLLAFGAGTVASRRRRQRHLRAWAGARRAQHADPLAGPSDRRRRPRRRHRGDDGRRRAGAGLQARRQGQGARRAPEEGRAARGAGAQARLPSLGLLSEHRQRRPLPGETHRR